MRVAVFLAPFFAGGRLPAAALLAVCLGGVGPLACAADTAQAVEAADAAGGGACFAIGRGQHRTCVEGPLPSEAAGQRAHALEADPGALSVYIVRDDWLDTRHRVNVLVDGQPAADTLPASLVRLHLRPGAHRLALTWQGDTQALDVAGAAGEVRLVRLRGAVTFNGSHYGWMPADGAAPGPSHLPDHLPEHLRLVADVTLPAEPDAAPHAVPPAAAPAASGQGREDHAVAPGLLGAVQGLVGPVEQVGGIFAAAPAGHAQ